MITGSIEEDELQERDYYELDELDEISQLYVRNVDWTNLKRRR